VFTKLRKATASVLLPACLPACLSACLSVCLPVCPSARMEQLGSHWTDFHEILYPSIFRKSAEQTRVSLKPGNKNGTARANTRVYSCDNIVLNSSENGKCCKKT
jgi:hypothetical protein